VDPFPACSESERGLPKNKYRKSIDVFDKSATVFSFQLYFDLVTDPFISSNIDEPIDLAFVIFSYTCV
jgi:hypothetical protein